MKFKYLINEVLNQPLSYTWKYKSKEWWEGVFKIDKTKYNVTIGKYIESGDTEIWELTFNMSSSVHREVGNVTGTGHSFQVFATVKKMLLEFLKSKKGDDFELRFSAKEPSRKKLYDKFANMINKDTYLKFDKTRNREYANLSAVYFFRSK